MTFFQSRFVALSSRVLLLLAACCVTRPLIAAERPDISGQLEAGELAEAQTALEKHLAANSNDDLARFQLGSIQVFRAVEQLAQDGARYGTLSRTMMIPLLRVGGFAAGTVEPEPVAYDDIRKVLERFQEGINKAEQTLAPIKDQKLQWKLDLIGVLLDLNGDGQATPQESLFVLYSAVANRGRQPAAPGPFEVGFDSADVYWLRGYCHVLSAMADMILAYDHERLFDITAHAFFAKPKSAFTKRRDAEANRDDDRQGLMEDIPDLIAAIHLMNFKLREPKRLASAQEHLLAMIQMSRKSWDLIAVETDNDREWIPGPNQQSVIEGLVINPERIDTWRRFLTEAEDVILGKKLVPFWRRGFKGGVNLGKVFTEPRDFDLVLWVQGTDALPYLEEGDVTSPETWQEFQRVFRGEFIGFAAWIN